MLNIMSSTKDEAWQRQAENANFCIILYTIVESLY